MSFSFFSKTDKKRKPRFFNPPKTSTADDSSASSGQDRAESGAFHPIDLTNPLSYRRIRLLPPKETMDDRLARLLKNAENAGGHACSEYLEQMLNLLKSHPELVNCVPKKFHSNPLEVVIRLGDTRVAKELLALKAWVRPENRSLLKRIEHLLQPTKSHPIKSIGSHPRAY